jgi:hypothetical protein
MHTEQMMTSHPRQGHMFSGLVRAAELSADCAQTCTVCADACLGEENLAELRKCIALNLDCADICSALGAIALRRLASQDNILRLMLQVCADACQSCADECGLHAAMHKHCRICEAVCRECERACRNALSGTH